MYNDVLYAQSWTDVQVIDLGSSCPRGAVKGKKPTSESDEDVYVVPCELSETLSFAWCVLVCHFRPWMLKKQFDRLQDASKALSNPAEIYLGISAEDSSIVYYKLSSGIVKPPL